MRKPTYSEKYMYKNLLWLSVAIFAFFPFLTTFLLQFLYLNTYTDAAYGSLGIFISVITSILSFLSVYMGLGILTVTVINFGKNAVGIIRLAFLSHLISFLSGFLTCTVYEYVSSGFFITDTVLMEILMLAIDAVANLLVYIIVYIILIRITEKRKTVLNTPPLKKRYTDIRHPLIFAAVISVAVHSGIQFLMVIYDMITAINDPSIGPPINTSDVIYWILEYLSVFVIAALGMVVIELIFLLSEYYIKSGRNKNA